MESPIKNCPICKFREDDTCKRKRKLIENIEQERCVHYAPSLYHQFMLYFENDWLDRGVYQTTDFVDVFNISRHLARHYLYEILTLQEHKVFRIKKHNKSYYIKRGCSFTLDTYENGEGVHDAYTQAEQFKNGQDTPYIYI